MVVSYYQRRLLGAMFLTLFLLTGMQLAVAETASSSLTLVIKNQVFEPQTLTIPAGVAVKILIKNEDVLPAEFESNDLGKEKVIPGGTQLPLYLEALTPGSYKFFNDFHPSGTGTIVVEKSK